MTLFPTWLHYQFWSDIHRASTRVCSRQLVWLQMKYFSRSFPSGSDDKESACSAGDPGSIPGVRKIPWRRNSNPFSILARKIPWMEEPWGLQSMGSQRVGHNWATSLSLEIFFQIKNFESSLLPKRYIPKFCLHSPKAPCWPLPANLWSV